MRRAGRCGRTQFKVRSRGARTVSPSAVGSGRLLHRNRHRSRPRARWHGRTCPGAFHEKAARCNDYGSEIRDHASIRTLVSSNWGSVHAGVRY